MKELVLKALPRTVTGKQVKALRREGRLPGVIYGRGLTPILLTLDAHEASRVVPTITSSQLLVVQVDQKSHTVLVREKQRMPTTGALLHIDFQEVSLTEKLHAKVVIELVGESPAVKLYNGILVTGLEMLEVEALPRDLPERITVDVSILTEPGQAVHVRDIVLSSKVEVLDNDDEIIVVVTAQAAEEVEEGAVGGIEPEVVERGKKEDEF